jgi:hypothetical protein
MHSPPAVSAEGDHQCQHESAIAPCVTNVPLSTWEPGLPFNQQRMICAFGCHQQPSRKDAPDQRYPVSWTKGSLLNLVRCSGIICQRFYTLRYCFHSPGRPNLLSPVTNTRGNRISITSYHKPNSLHHPRATKLSTCRHFHTRAFQTAPFGSSCQASLSACVKKQPPAKGLFEFHL